MSISLRVLAGALLSAGLVLPGLAEAQAGFARDPFAPLLVEAPTGPTQLGSQRYPLGDYQLVGVVWGDAHPHALVVDPDGRSWVLQPGDYLGDRWGMVRTVQASGLVVVEAWVDPLGDYQEQQFRLDLPI